MKKTYLMLALAAGVLASCDMDKEPYNALPDTEATQTPTDFANARIGLYSALRSSIAGNSFVNATEIQCDNFNAVSGFSNTLGDMYRWDFNTSGSYFSTVYGNYQAMIARANFIIDGYNNCDMSDPNNFSKTDIANTRVVKGDAFFTRAYAIFGLAQYFCNDYEPSTADAADSGVSYQLHYAPSSNAATYPERYTQAQTYQQIKDDLDSAAVYITAEGEPSYAYFSKDCITALRARVALAMDDYAGAARYASELIDQGTYTLAEDAEELDDLWHNDGGNETIMQIPVPSRNELPSNNGQIYQPYQAGQVPDYIPTKELLELYSANDYRRAVYFNQQEITTNSGATAKVYAFNKYMDQGALYKKLSGYEYARFVIEPKIFRIGEIYLIAAEAYAQLGDTENGTHYLNELKAARIKGYDIEAPENQYADKTTLMNEVKNERRRELLGEGTRLFDLKRWHEGVKRGTPQDRSICNIPGASTTDLNQPAGAYRMTWPIPKHETDVNKKVKQNAGY